ncbi:Mitochondrial copper homeostasis protein [Teratosphaeriaceae sp. CCFEE 6253]|nr:Mitochondrial copper homeostasis protein [Teratosphaeriaceae sp. CCFEE 6253]
MSRPKDEEKETEWQKGGGRFTGYGVHLPYRKRNSEYFDPCQEVADKSLKCLRRNGGDRALCTDFFQSYKDCKQKWVGSVASQGETCLRRAANDAS